MKVSTRGRYALRLMIDLAHHRNEGYVSLKEISARQDITVRYLEQIIAILLKAGFVQSFRGEARGGVPPFQTSARIHHGRNPETDGRLPSAYFLHGSPRKSVPTGGRMRHAAFLARAPASH